MTLFNRVEHFGSMLLDLASKSPYKWPATLRRWFIILAPITFPLYALCVVGWVIALLCMMILVVFIFMPIVWMRATWKGVPFDEV